MCQVLIFFNICEAPIYCVLLNLLYRQCIINYFYIYSTYTLIKNVLQGFFDALKEHFVSI